MRSLWVPHNNWQLSLGVTLVLLFVLGPSRVAHAWAGLNQEELTAETEGSSTAASGPSGAQSSPVEPGSPVDAEGAVTELLDENLPSRVGDLGLQLETLFPPLSHQDESSQYEPQAPVGGALDDDVQNLLVQASGSNVWELERDSATYAMGEVSIGRGHARGFALVVSSGIVVLLLWVARWRFSHQQAVTTTRSCQ